MKYAGLDGVVLDPADSYLRSISVTPRFQSDFVEPCTRASFSQNPADVRGFVSLMAAGASKATSVYGGNVHLIERMIRLSNAELRLNSRVTKISPGRHRRYRLSIAEKNESADAEFNAVVLAAPLQSSQVDLGDLGLGSIASRLPPYVETHVTHFIIPAAIDPGFFGPFLNASIPADLLTATTDSHDPDILTLSRFDCFCLRGCEPGDESAQGNWVNLYRVVSRHVMEDSDLVRMIGRQFRKGSNLSDYDIHWAHRQAWPHAFPRYRSKRALLGQIEIARGLVYVSAAEEVVTSMEMSWNAGEMVFWRIH